MGNFFLGVLVGFTFPVLIRVLRRAASKANHRITGGF